VKRIKLDARARALSFSLSLKNREKHRLMTMRRAKRRARANIIITCGTRHYPSAWNRGRENRERRASHTARGFRRIQVIDGLTVPRENIPRERASVPSVRVRAYDIRKTGVARRPARYDLYTTGDV